MPPIRRSLRPDGTESPAGGRGRLDEYSGVEPDAMKFYALWTASVVFLAYMLFYGYCMVFDQALWKRSRLLVRGRLDELDMSQVENRIHIRILGGIFLALATYMISGLVGPIVRRFFR